jgi:hypothetical protein
VATRGVKRFAIVDQPLGRFSFSEQIVPFNNFLDRGIWLLLAIWARASELTETFLGQFRTAGDRCGVRFQPTGFFLRLPA